MKSGVSMVGQKNLKTIFLTVEGVGDRAIDYGTGSTVANLARALTDYPPTTLQTLQVVRTASVLPPALLIESADIRFGDAVRIITLTPGVEVDEQLIASCSATLDMLSGPSSSASFRLEPGSSTIGRVSTNDVTIVDPSISRHHATVNVTNAFVTIEDNGSTNGVTVAGELVTESTHVRSGEQIKLGQSEAVLTHRVVPVSPPDASYLEVGSATVARHQGRTVALPSPPLLSDGGARRSGRLSLGRNQQKHEIELFHMMLATLTAQLEQEQQVERAVRLAEAPSFSEVAHAIASRHSLWARRAADDGGIEARIGLGQARSRNQFEPIGAGPQDLRAKLAATVERFSSVAAAPVTVDFRELGTVGVQGPIEQARALAYSMVGQLCATFGPDQLGIACRPGDMAAEWEWLKWLPHTDFVGSASGIADAEFVSWVSALFNKENLAHTSLAARPAAILLILDDDRPLPLAVLARLIQEGPALGIHALLVSNDAKGFDTVLGATVRVADGIASLHRSDLDPIGGIVVESCDRKLVDGLARMISPIGYREYSQVADAVEFELDEDGQAVGVRPFRLGGQKPTVLASMKRRAVTPPTSGDFLNAGEDFPAATETRQLPDSVGISALAPVTPQVINITDSLPEPEPADELPAPQVPAAVAAQAPGQQDAASTPQPLAQRAAQPPAQQAPIAPVSAPEGPSPSETPLSLPAPVLPPVPTPIAGVQPAAQQPQALAPSPAPAPAAPAPQAPAPPQAPVNPPQAPVNPPQAPVNPPQAPVNPPQAPVSPPQAPAARAPMAPPPQALPPDQNPLTAAAAKPQPVQTPMAQPPQALPPDQNPLSAAAAQQPAAPSPMAQPPQALPADQNPLSAVAKQRPTPLSQPPQALPPDQNPLSAAAQQPAAPSPMAQAPRALPPDQNPLSAMAQQQAAQQPAAQAQAAGGSPAQSSLNLTALPHPDDDSRLVLGTVNVDESKAPAVFALNLDRDRTLGLHGGQGTGKTTALRSVAAAAGMLRVDPGLIPTVYYLDVRGDLESVQAMPHVSGASKNDIVGFRSVVAGLEQLLADRAARFEQAGIETIEEYRITAPTESMNRIIVLVDDMAALAEMLDSLHPGRWSELARRMLDHGGPLGVHLVFTVNDQGEVDEDIIPKVGRWLHLGIDSPDGSPGRPGQAVIGKAKVRFATIDGPSPQAALSPVVG